MGIAQTAACCGAVCRYGRTNCHFAQSSAPRHGGMGAWGRYPPASDTFHARPTTFRTMTQPQVLISEVGPRDGLQSVKATMPTADKLRWIDALVAAGLREIEVGSFVSARLLPQMADVAEVVRHALTHPGITVMALAPNLRGAEAALAAGVHKVTLPVSASAAHSLANVRKTREAMVEEVRAVAHLRAALGAEAGAAHMHNTRGLGLANCLAAYDVGVRTFDASLGGLGGCPYAPGASGNVVTEDLVFMFEAMGIDTGVDLERLMAARAPLQAGLPGEPVYGMTPEAGLPKGWVRR